MNYLDKNALTRVRKYYPNVTRVVDADKPVKIVVQNRDVSKALPQKPDDCAMARAAKRCIAGVDGAIIHSTTAYLIRGNRATRYRVPQSVYREIVSFDRHKDFRPGDYQLSAIAESSKMLGRRKGSDTNENSKQSKRNKPFIVRHHTMGIR